MERGTCILVILVVGVGLWFALKKLLLSVMRRNTARSTKGESMEGIKERTDTLTIRDDLARPSVQERSIIRLVVSLNIPSKTSIDLRLLTLQSRMVYRS